MNKTEFIKAVADKAGITLKDAKAAVDASLEVIQDEVVAGNEVAFVGFGTFAKKTRAARKGINPATKQQIDIPETQVPTFKAGAVFKDKVKA